MTGPRFDPQRSDAIRTMLIDTVEQTPARDHRRHVRIVVLAILAALGIGVGSSAVAMALGGIDLFGPPAATQAAVAPATASPTPTPTPSATPTPEPHPLVVTGDPIAPRDVVSAPPATPAWTIDVPGAGDICQDPQVIDVSDGYALVQSGPTQPPEDLAYDCAPTETKLWLSFVDTRDGTVVWTREWTWPFEPTTYTTANVRVLGTSGHLLVQTVLSGAPQDADPRDVPAEVLDLASGQTLGSLDYFSEHPWDSILPIADDSGDVIAVRRTPADPHGGTGQVTVSREDPLDPSSVAWSVSVDASRVSVSTITNESSVLQISYASTDVQPHSMMKVVDIDSGAIMVEGPQDRRYLYLDGVTIRETMTGSTISSIAGIDDAGNELWSRSDDGRALQVATVTSPQAVPGAGELQTSTVMVSFADGRVEMVDGLTGESRWIVDGSTCTVNPYFEPFQRTPDGLVVQWSSGYSLEDATTSKGPTCAFTMDGEVVDVAGRPAPHPFLDSPDGWTATYELKDAWGSGGVATYKVHSPEGTVPTATVRDAVTGAVLWTRPIASDERWAFAGGYLVGLSGGTMFGIG
ncbi:hypothetical protein GCM10010988_18050 [Cnuibacter physcomitrellae]|uniref:Uncharacterized protein n=1 Tax=Cnuibacter physcomitrellae TaxID=1619308 RepID=A0A1X9LRH9_9MICO|nr:hypothetical protein [Cnuibacter physcomitrellae]ARJ06541.1 hypothetical protein B5808_15920 [Cnuibacter physcomitrellae]GGI38249.1 hypothetical protein GCM10010988_18050 [Cnuibacter physcomitrellae]